MPSTTSPLERVARAIAPDSSTTTRQKIDSLTAFNSVLHDVSLEQAQSIFSAVPLANFYLVFGSLDNEDNEEQQLSSIMCVVIGKLLRPFSYDMIMQDENNHTFLSQGLNHFSPEVRQLSLEQVAKCLDSSSSMHQVATSTIFPFVLTTIAFRDTGVANRAIDIAAKIGFNKPECLFVNNASIIRGLQETSDAVRFRVYDLIIRVAGSSDDAFRMAESSGFLVPVLDQVNSDDILVQLNAIELLKEVAITPCGLDFLERSGVLQMLASQIGNSEINDTSTVLVKSLILKFFGKLGENQAIQFEPIQCKYQVFDKLQQCLDDTNKEILTVAIAVVGLIGSHAAGLAMLLDSPLMNKFMEGYQASTGDIKAVYIQSLSKFIGISGGDPAVEQMTRQVYQTINGAPSTLENLMQTATQPLEEVRVPTFALMQAIASHSWGQQEMARAPAFLGYLLDRSTEHTPLGQKWKFGIVQTLASAENSRQIFGQHYTLMLQFIRQGPYYRPTEAAAIMESA
ncbi:hypothetical protein K492DRAFT_144143 [Lichtheimia hyalospora FSU 10163]|nr:hypothetical protein K492DRAFT_144143 [Lichtheimia hyalospora FSU 10163]